MKRCNRVIITFIFTILGINGFAQNAECCEPCDTAVIYGNWLQQLRQCQFHINDPRIQYPDLLISVVRYIIGGTEPLIVMTRIM